MARILRSVYSFIVLISFVHYGSSSSITVTPNTTTASSSPPVTPNTTTASSSPPATVTATSLSTSATPIVITTSGNTAPSFSVHRVVSTSSSNGTTTSNTSQIAPSKSGNVSTSSSVPSEAATKRFKARVTVKETYISDYDDINSNKSIKFIKEFITKVTTVLNGQLSGNITIEVKNLTNGSVVVDFEIVARQSSNATASSIKDALEHANKTSSLGYTLTGDITVVKIATISATVIVVPSTSAPVPKATTAPPTSSTKGTKIWDKAIDLATPMGTVIIVVVAVAVIIILLIALICVCCKYRTLKKKTHFPDHMAINDSEWIRSSDDLLMWERNLRASEVKTTNGVSNRPINDKRT